jgi:hypothetical protein
VLSGFKLADTANACRARNGGPCGTRACRPPASYLEQDAKDVDRWRAKAITGHAAPPAAPVSLAEIQAEMKRLSALAASMQGAQADAPQPASSAASEPDESRSEEVSPDERTPRRWLTPCNT